MPDIVFLQIEQYLSKALPPLDLVVLAVRAETSDFSS